MGDNSFARHAKRAIGPQIFKVRELLCSAHSGKGTGLVCSECVADRSKEFNALLIERGRLREVLQEMTADRDAWKKGRIELEGSDE